MPQMLHYLLKKRHDNNEQTSSSSKSSSSNDLELERQWKQVLNAMQEADTFIEHAPPEHVPPIWVEAKEKATQQYQQAKLGSCTSSGANNGVGDLDFGVVCVYTCTNSCGGGSGNDSEASDAALGAYREEYAWVQSSSS